MIDQFISHLKSLNYEPPIEKIALDGKIHRFDKDGKKNGWLIGFNNHTKSGNPYIVAQFGDWKTGEIETYTSTVKFSAQEKKQISKDIEVQKKRVEEEKNKIQNQCAEKAEEYFKNCSENSTSDYLKRKQIKSLYGSKTIMTSMGRTLIIPMKDIDGKMWGYQTIYPDGKKYFLPGQKKQGTFHIIEGSKIMCLAEGFATAASIHEATGYSVAVAFDAGNLIHVANALGENIQLVCGDDDTETEENPGRIKAEEAANKIGVKAVFPVFKNKNPKQSDFNDLAVAQGLDAVKLQIEGKPKKGNTIRCLGYDGDDYCFITNKKPKVTRISASGFSKLSLMNLMDLSYWESNFPSGKSSFALEKAVDTLMVKSRSVGVFRSENIRGTGVWQDQEKTVVNIGNGLWVDGEILGYADFETKFIYESSNVIQPPKKDFLTASEVLTFKKLLDQLSWKVSSSPQLLLGWLALSGICGSISWRPHIWVTGPAGSGKTTVMKEIVSKMAVNSIQFLGKATEAGIRSSIGSNCLPILFDENETTDKNSQARVSNVIDLFRVASTETEAKVVKGTPSGKAISYSVRFMAAVSSIAVSLSTEQDLSRFSVFEMVTNKNNGFMEKGGVRDQLWDLLSKEFCQKFWSRSVYGYKRWQENFKTLYPILMSKVSARYADQYGSLIAAYYMCIMNVPLKYEEALIAVNEVFDLKNEEQESENFDASQECLDYILWLKLVDVGASYSVGQILEHLKNHVLDSGEKEQFLENLLMKNGMRSLDGGKSLFVCAKHTELNRLMGNSKWPGDWKRTLARLKGAQDRATIRLFGKVCLGVKVPI